MAKWKKAEEGYFADSFERDSVCAYTDTGISTSQGISNTIALNNCTCNDWDGVASLAKGECCLTVSDNAVLVNNADVYSFTNLIVELQEKVRVLELAIKQQQTKVLRHYDRSDFLTLGG